MDQTRDERAQKLTLGIAALAVFLAAADTYVVVLALQDMMAGAGIGVDELQKATPIISAFLLGYLAVLPLIGRLADLRGVRAVLLGCLLLFALGSLLTAVATSLGPMVLGRALQGVGGGGLVPATMALVAAMWPEERRGRPLGIVGAVQETGAAVGPVMGAALLAWASWRWIFFANLAGALVLWLALRSPRWVPPLPAGGVPPANPAAAGASAHRLPQILILVGVALLVVGVMQPEALATHLYWGYVWVPWVGASMLTSPLALLSTGLLVAGAFLGFRQGNWSATLQRVDVLGSALLALSLGMLVLAFTTADPQIAFLSPGAVWQLTISALALVAFVWHSRRTAHPLIPRGAMQHRIAKATLAVNIGVGAALVAALVDVPFFAEATVYAGNRLGASLVLMWLLVTVPVGAYVGGALLSSDPAWAITSVGLWIAALGLAGMAFWNVTILDSPVAKVQLLLTGLGFGMCIAPINAALLSATPASAHGVASALVVVFRMIGMLVGLSVLTAVGLRVFYVQQDKIGSPAQLCPDSPQDCEPYIQATQLALVHELNVIFGIAAACAAAGAIMAMLWMRPGPAATEAAEATTTAGIHS